MIFTDKSYQVFLCTNGKESPLTVYKTLAGYSSTAPIGEPSETLRKIYDGLQWNCKSLTCKTFYTKHEFTSSATLRIVLPNGVKSAVIKPESAAEKVVFHGNSVTVATEETLYFVLQPNGNINETLTVFLDKKITQPKEKRNIITFTNGVYTAENCDRIVPDEHGNPILQGITDDTLIYIDKDAVLQASIELKNVKNVEIAGTGIITLSDRCIGAEEEFENGPYWGLFRYHAKPNLLIRSGCEQITVRDVTLDCEFRGIVIRNSKQITVSNVKIFASTENADGINGYNTSDLLVENCFINSKDDCFCLYNNGDSIPTLFDEGYPVKEALCRNVVFRNCTILTNCRPFVFGGHATGSTDPRCLIENLHIYDCDIIETPNHLFGYDEQFSYYWTAIMRILSQSESIVRNITFENIRVNLTSGYNGKLFHLHVRSTKEASYSEVRGYAIEDITFRNIRMRPPYTHRSSDVGMRKKQTIHPIYPESNLKM